MTAPDRRNFVTIVASRRTRLPLSANEPAPVFIRSFVAMLSLSRIGMPCSGPRTLPRRRSRSRARAVDSACGFVSMTAPRSGSSSLIRRRYARVSATLDSSRFRMRRWSLGIDASNQARSSSSWCRGRSSSSSSPVVAGPAARTDVPDPASSRAAPPAAVASMKCRRLSRRSRMTDTSSLHDAALVRMPEVGTAVRWRSRDSTRPSRQRRGRRSASRRDRQMHRFGRFGRHTIGRDGDHDACTMLVTSVSAVTCRGRSAR